MERQWELVSDLSNGAIFSVFYDQIVTTQFIKGTDQIVTLPLSDVLHALVLLDLGYVSPSILSTILSCVDSYSCRSS